MRKVQMKGDDNITKRALQQEVKTGTKGLAHECMELSNELGLQNVMNGNTSKTLIKRTIAKKIYEENWKSMEDSKKVRDKVKGNHKQSHSDLSCTLCNSMEEMSQEHLETCKGTEHERRGLDMGTWRGLLDFWRRATKNLGATVT